MKIPISQRLLACCGFVAPGDRVADIGTDHGYLGIWLLSQGTARSVIASDIHPAPLSAAQRNAEKFGCAGKMEFYLSDGVQSIPRDFDTLVCAGMGGDTMVSILSAAPWLKNNKYRLVLQCQSKTAMLRRYLSENGWHITEETVIPDGRFLYTVMEICWETAPLLTLGQCYFPPALLENPSASTAEYYRSVTFRLKRAITGQGQNADPELVTAFTELWNDPELQWLKEAHDDNSK